MTEQYPMPPWQGGDPKAAAKAAKAYAKASRPWYKKKRFILPIGLVVFIVIIVSVNSGGGGGTGGPQVVDTTGTPSASSGSASAGSGGGASSSSSASSAAAGTEGNPVRVGQTVQLEGTQYTVTKADTSPTIGDKFAKQDADGVFVVVELTIENKKDETKTFSDSAATLILANGKKYSTDDDSSIYADKPLILEDMQPDVPKSGTLVFDVPVGAAKGAVLELSDLFGNGDAYIDLGLA